METQPRVAPYAIFKANIKARLVLLMCFMYIIQFLSGSQKLNLVLGVLAVLVFFSSVSSAKAIPRLLSLGMFTVGVVMNLWKGAGWEGIINGIITNLPLLTLLTLVPMLSIPLKIGGYFQSIHYYIDKMGGSPSKQFGSLSFFLFALGPILNLGSVRVLHDMVQELNLGSKLLAKAYLVGFSTVILWSPYFASVAMVLYYLNVSVFTYLPIGLTFAFLQLILGNFIFWLGNRNERQAAAAAEQRKHVSEDHGVTNVRHKRMMWKLLFILIFLMASIFIIEFATKWPMLFLVSFLSLLFPIAWSILFRKWKLFQSHYVEYKEKTVPVMSNEYLVFLSAGLFGQALTGTVFANGIKMMLNHLSGISFFLFIVSVILIVFIMTFIGIHQIVTVTLLITQMEPSVIGASPESLALLLMLSWAISAVAGPINAVNLLVSMSVKASPIAVGLKWNGLYLISMAVSGSLIVYLLNV